MRIERMERWFLNIAAGAFMITQKRFMAWRRALHCVIKMKTKRVRSHMLPQERRQSQTFLHSRTIIDFEKTFYVTTKQPSKIKFPLKVWGSQWTKKNHYRSHKSEKSTFCQIGGIRVQFLTECKLRIWIVAFWAKLDVKSCSLAFIIQNSFQLEY